LSGIYRQLAAKSMTAQADMELPEGFRVTLCLLPKQKLLVAWNGQKVGDFSLEPLVSF